MKGKDRNTGDDDTALWRTVTRDVTPNPERNAAPAKPAGPKPKPRPAPQPKPAHATPPPATDDLTRTLKTGPRLDPIARRTARKLKSGRIELDGKVDLHGLSQDAAHSALFRFIPEASAAGKKNVLVVTGKGKGILQRAVPMWLSSGRLAEYVISVSAAPQALGGAGALYVVLRRVGRRGGR